MLDPVIGKLTIKKGRNLIMKIGDNEVGAAPDRCDRQGGGGDQTAITRPQTTSNTQRAGPGAVLNGHKLRAWLADTPTLPAAPCPPPPPARWSTTPSSGCTYRPS